MRRDSMRSHARSSLGGVLSCSSLDPRSWVKKKFTIIIGVAATMILAINCRLLESRPVFPKNKILEHNQAQADQTPGGRRRGRKKLPTPYLLSSGEPSRGATTASDRKRTQATQAVARSDRKGRNQAIASDGRTRSQAIASPAPPLRQPSQQASREKLRERKATCTMALRSPATPAVAVPALSQLCDYLCDICRLSLMIWFCMI